LIDMEHVYFFDGNQKKISWVIKTKDSTDKQERTHAEIYLDKISEEQSKYVALHTGIFWGIGTYIIKNEDILNIMLDSKSMYEHLSKKIDDQDLFIQTKTMFLNQFLEHRKLKVKYHLIDSKENIAKKLLNEKPN